MSLRNLITTFTERYSKQIDRLKNEVKTADAIVIGAGIYIITAMLTRQNPLILIC